MTFQWTLRFSNQKRISVMMGGLIHYTINRGWARVRSKGWGRNEGRVGVGGSVNSSRPRARISSNYRLNRSMFRLLQQRSEQVNDLIHLNCHSPADGVTTTAPCATRQTKWQADSQRVGTGTLTMIHRYRLRRCIRGWNIHLQGYLLVFFLSVTLRNVEIIFSIPHIIKTASFKFVVLYTTDIVVKSVTFVVLIRKVLASNFGAKTGCTDRFNVISLSICNKYVRLVCQIGQDHCLPHCSPIILHSTLYILGYWQSN